MPSDLLERPALAGNESFLDRVLLVSELKQLFYSSAEQSAGSSFFDTLLRPSCRLPTMVDPTTPSEA